MKVEKRNVGKEGNDKGEEKHMKTKERRKARRENWEAE